MKRTFYACLFFLTFLQFIDFSSVYGQATVYSSKRGGVTISIDDTPDADSKVPAWESNRVLFNKYGFKFNIGLQSEGLSRPAISDEVKKMINDGHEMLDHCPRDNVYQFSFNTHLEDSLLYMKNGVKQPGVQSVSISLNLVSVTLKTGTTLDPTAIPILAGRTRLLYRRYLKDSIHYPKVLAQPGGSDMYISHTDGYLYLNQAGYTACAYDGGGRDEVITKTYNINQSLYHPAFNMKRADWGDIHSFDSTTNWVANNIAKHQVVSILYHYTNLTSNYLDQTDKFLKWCKDNNIPLLTMSQWMTNLNGSTPDPTTNVFPDLRTDLDGDGQPDGFEKFYDVVINKADADAPGGASLTKYVGGNFFEVKGLGGVEKGKNVVSFSAKGQLNATIRLILKINLTNVVYCDTTITVSSAIWKTYKANLIVPDNVVLSDINFLVNNIGSGNSVTISNVQLYKSDKLPTTRIRDTTITVKQTVSFSVQSGCTNYKWSTGETAQSIVFDGAKSGPGTFSISYTAVDSTGASISDNCTVTVKGLIYSPGTFSFPALSAAGILKITANIPWTITSKKLKTTLSPEGGTGTLDIAVSMANNASTLPVDDTLTINSSQAPVIIPVHQAGFGPQLSVSKNVFNNILKTGTTESVQIISTANWKVSGKPDWITVSPSIGNGNANMTFKVDSNKLTTERTGNIIIKSPNGVLDSLSATISLSQLGTSPFFIIPSTDRVTIGPTNGDTVSLAVSSNIKWKIISSVSWMTTNPAAWITNDGDKKIIITLDTKYLSAQDLTGTDIQGSFTLEEDSSLPTRIIKSIGVTLKAIPALLVIPTHTLTFKGIGSATIDIQSNLPWSTEKKSVANWLAVSPSFSTGNATMKIDCTTANTGSNENSVYLLIYQTKGALKDSILLKQAASPLGITDYQHSGIKIYPLPAVETLNIDLPDNIDLKFWNIYNTMGVELLKGRIETKNKLQIPLARLASGVYFIALSSDTQTIGLKFTK